MNEKVQALLDALEAVGISVSNVGYSDKFGWQLDIEHKRGKANDHISWFVGDNKGISILFDNQGFATEIWE